MGSSFTRTVSSSSEKSSFDIAHLAVPVRGVRRNQGVGPGIYLEFEKQVERLDRSLRKLCNEAQKLRSSGGILSVSTRLRQRLGKIIRFFHRNALQLYPDDVPDRPRALRLIRKSKARAKLPKESEPMGTAGGNFTTEFRLFLNDIDILLDCFRQFPQFNDELSDWSFVEELKAWAVSLTEFDFQFNTQAVQKYLHDSMTGVGVHIDALAEDIIPTFTKFGLPAVRAAQDRGSSNLKNQTLIATLFASIAASMIQVWEPGKNGTYDNLTNAAIVFWYMALIFSVSSAVNGLLGLSWVHAVYRIPDHRVPWWVLVWIKRFPLVSLCVSVACFFIGLIVFVYASLQTRATATVTTALSCVCFALVLMSSWLTYELLLHARNEDQMWITLTTANIKYIVLSVLSLRWWASWKRLLMNETRVASFDIEKFGAQVPSKNFIFNMTNVKVARDEPRDVSFWLGYDKDMMLPSDRARHRWHEAVRRIISGNRSRTTAGNKKEAITSAKFSHLTSVARMTMRFQSVSKLVRIKCSQLHHINERHEALVRDLQFAPDGKHLITASWDAKSLLLRVGIPMLCERVLQFPPMFGYAHQVEWSSNCRRVLVRSNHQVDIWALENKDKEGRFRFAEHQLQYRRSPEDGQILCAHWHEDSESFVLVQGDKMMTMNIEGKLLRQYSLDLSVRDVCMTSDSRWMICVGRKNGAQTNSQFPGRYAIVVWDLYEQKIAKEMPVFHEMNDVVIASDNTSILVNYENKSPSQLWKVRSQPGDSDLILDQTYVPKSHTSFASLPSIFGGEHDHLVLRIAIDGDIFVWDRDSAALIHRLSTLFTYSGEVTSFAWNRASEVYMFATGTNDGTVHIFTIPPEMDTEDECDISLKGHRYSYLSERTA